MILDKIYVSNTEPYATNILWAKPIDGGAFALYAFISGKWGVLKLMNDNGTPYPDDDTADDCYTKEEIDSKLADILGLDAEGVAELKALIEDDDALTGLLGELKDEVKSVEVFHYLQGSHKPLPVGKYNYTISGLINVPKSVYNEGNYLIFRYPEDITTNSFHYLVFEEKTVGEITGYFCVHSYSPSSEPPAWVEDAFGYTRSETDNLLGNKVDKVQGKGLSTNDYTDSDKEKVSSISLPGETYSISQNQWILDGNIATNSEGVLKIEATSWLTPTIVNGRLVLTRSQSGVTPSFKIYSPFEGTLRIRCYEWADYHEHWDLELGYLTDYPEKYHYLEPFYESSDNTDIAIYVKAGWNTIRGGSNSGPLIIGGISLQRGILALNSKVTEHNMGLMTPQLLSDLNHKVDKVSNATNGNFAALDSNGNLIDSGHKHSDYLTQHQDLTNYVQKSQTAGLLKNDGTVDTNTYLTQHQDISGKEDITPIEAVASGTTTITAQVNKYYEVAGTVSSLTVTLPTPTTNTEVTMVVVHLTVGASPTILVTSSATVAYSAAYAVVANKEYELSCLYNGSKWIVSSMEVAV